MNMNSMRAPVFFFRGQGPFIWLTSFLALFGVYISVASDSNFMVWLGVEVNSFGFLGLMSVRKMDEGSMLKYFLAQVLGSSGVFLGVVLSMGFTNGWFLSWVSSMFMASGVLCKLGMFPFHMWFPSIVVYSDWFVLMWLLTIQKFGPMLMAGFMCHDVWFVLLSCVLTSFVGSVGGIDKTTVKGLLAYSSLLNMGWVCLCAMGVQSLFFLYFLLYSLQVLLALSCLWVLDFKKLAGNNVNMGSFLGVLGISSIPPFPLFLLKMLTISSFLMENSLVVILLICSSLISLCYYMRAAVLFISKKEVLDKRLKIFFFFFLLLWVSSYSLFALVI
uniref:NADH dehydrogenase subunit 2 n=1 Tax=Vignadula atrata TaxID=1289577 RepID=UPI001FA6DA9A|nr:NADH dehydrogenase subunit 2 [Vignadula atrata]ULT46696.1 NADH dehydrogenase subunit 2 [Vignadula atrata]